MRATTAVLVVMLATLCGIPCAVHAQASRPVIGVDHERPPPLESDKADDEGPSYAWQTLLADTASLGVLFAGVLTYTSGWQHENTQPALLVLGLAGYIAGTPLIHYFGHRNEWALYSLLLRVAAPALVVGGFLLVGRAFDDSKGPLPEGVPLAGAIGLFAGLAMLAVVPLVDAVMANEPKKRHSRAALVPFVTPRADGGGLMFTTRL